MAVSVLVLVISALLRERMAICLVAMACTIVTVQGAPDNRGTEFIIGYMENFPWNNNNRNVELFITTAKTTTVNVRVTAPRYSDAIINEAFSVTAGTVQQLFFHPRIRLAGNEMSSKGVLVTSDDKVVIYGVNKEDYSCEAFLGLPTDVLGTEYYAVTYYPPYYQCELLIVGVNDSTRVSITVGDAIGSRYITWGGTNYYKGNTLSVTLNRYDTFQLVSDGDLSGTYINSSKPVSVFSGNRKTNIGIGSSDHLVEHLTHVDTWGKRFVTVPVPLRTVGDYFKFIASEGNTYVTISGDCSNSFTLSKAGTAVQKTISSSAYCLIVSDKPIFVVQFCLSRQSHKEQTDPMMMVIPPVEQFGADYTFTTLMTYSSYFMFTIKESEKSGLRVDGNTFPSNTVYNTISGTDYVGGYISLTEGTHTVRHTSPISIFGGYLYGKGDRKSYGFAAGMRMAGINKMCVPTSTVVGDGVDNDCDGLIDEELCTTENQGKDDDGDGKTEEDCATSPSMTSDAPPTIQSTSTAVVTSDVETTTQNTPSHVVNVSCGNCCAKKNMSRQLNQEELKHAIQELKYHVAVNKTNLSANRRKRISVYDSRPSSVAIGCVALAVLIGICDVIVRPDMIRLVRSLSKCPHKCKHKTSFYP